MWRVGEYYNTVKVCPAIAFGKWGPNDCKQEGQSMLKVGQKEIDAVTEVINNGTIFRYHKDSQCERFERRWAEYTNTKHVMLCSSGTAALTAALAGLEIGPGHEVVVPAHTYMATAIAVLSVGAIPIIVDVDESIMMDPDALEAAIGPKTKAVIPVHMWGSLCDMDRILDIAKRHNLLVVEDACQCVGGFYGDRAAGSLGDAGAYSFNFFKNMTCGEGGAVILRNDNERRRAQCMIDPCNFYWEGKEEDFKMFVNSGSRASEIQGAMLNAQFDRLPDLLSTLRAQKEKILEATTGIGLVPNPNNCPEGDCAVRLMYLFKTPEQAEQFAADVGGGILKNTGRHNFTDWEPILNRRGSHHPMLNAFDLPLNADCRTHYDPDMCSKSLDILSRTVMIGLNPDDSPEEVDKRIETICEAAKKL